MDDKIIDFSDGLNNLDKEITSLDSKKESAESDIAETRQGIESLMNEINDFISETQAPLETLTSTDVILLEIRFNDNFHKEIKSVVEKVKTFPDMTALDVIMCCISGSVAALVDIFLIGKPKLVGRHQEFTGSVLTKFLKEIDGDKGVFKYLSKKCSVPYDLSSMREVVTPNNHRLRSLAHDPLFGLVFAVIDIFLGTTTCINDKGFLVIIPTKQASLADKLFAVFLYIGHLISDVCTARGLPIPGAFLTQLNFNNDFLNGISKMSEKMYRSGYDFRHMISMASSVTVSNFIITVYLEIVNQPNDIQNMFYENELQDMERKLKK